MTRRSPSFDWNHARTFLTVVEEGSLSAAARALGQTQPTVSRQIASLEEVLAVTLFERTGRSVMLTEAGFELLEHVQTMASGANMVSLSASGQSQTIEGLVRITGSELISAFVLPPILAKLAPVAPLLEIDIVSDNDLRDLARREADIAIRHSRPDQPNLISRRLRDETMRFYASRPYQEAYGVPTVENLANHQIISFVEVDRMLGYLLPTGLTLTKANFRLGTTSQIVAAEMARSGLGLVMLPDRVMAKFPELEPVLSEIDPFTIPTWLVTHRELRTSRRIRLVFDHVADCLS
ncbi:LysR family transcriptional regulator [Nioella aestuarii]|uniref:LysR family transcriptional regulator n=1 Tax=Nioella aestuarii TaxID=1662864 RepID=UPI003D7F82EA